MQRFPSVELRALTPFGNNYFSPLESETLVKIFKIGKILEILGSNCMSLISNFNAPSALWVLSDRSLSDL